MRRNIRRKAKHSNKNKKTLSNLLTIACILLTLIIIFNIFYIQKIRYNYKQIASTANEILENNISPEDSAIPEKELEKEKTDTTFKLSAIGDVMCHNTQYWDAYNSETGEYDFSYVFENISYYTKTADVCVASLETTFAGAERGYSNYPTFNSPDALAYSLKDIGVDIISTAGNHALDTGFSGLSRTIDVLDQADIKHLGTYKTAEDQQQILYHYIKGLKLAFINYTYGTNGIAIPSGKDFCVNLIDKDLMQKQIETAKSENADIIIACMHWGTEYRTTANSEQEKLADFLFENGVDIIIGNHPHVLEQMEKRTVTLEDGTTKEGFVIYALGNFITDQNAANTRNSIILDLTVTKHTNGTVSVDKAEYTPIYMYKNKSVQKHKMKLIDIERSIMDYESGVDTSITSNLYNTLKTELEKIKKIVGEEIK